MYITIKINNEDLISQIVSLLTRFKNDIDIFEFSNLEELEDMLFGIALEKAEDSEIISQEEGLKKLGLIWK